MRNCRHLGSIAQYEKAIFTMSPDELRESAKVG
jgi:hypothetical protein